VELEVVAQQQRSVARSGFRVHRRPYSGFTNFVFVVVGCRMLFCSFV
jgi:hypothetical protein